MKSVLKCVLLLVVLVSVLGGTAAAQEPEGAKLTATQSILVEQEGDAYGALASVTVDLALTPRFHVTYIYDRKWQETWLWHGHDVGVTLYFGGSKDLSATLGMRVKRPDDPAAAEERIKYALIAWRWGG